MSDAESNVPNELKEQLDDLAEELRDPAVVIGRLRIRERKAGSWASANGRRAPPTAPSSSPFLLRASLDALRGDLEQGEERFRRGANLRGGFGLVFHVAVTQLEHAEWLAGSGGADEARLLQGKQPKPSSGCRQLPRASGTGHREQARTAESDFLRPRLLSLQRTLAQRGATLASANVLW